MNPEQEAFALFLIGNATAHMKEARANRDPEFQLGPYSFGVVLQALDSLSSCMKPELGLAIKQLVAVMDQVY